jgi:hypothetical protein
MTPCWRRHGHWTRRSARAQIRLLTDAHPAMTMDDAYAIQAAWVAAKVAAGDPVIGWKIGLTSKRCRPHFPSIFRIGRAVAQHGFRTGRRLPGIDSSSPASRRKSPS